MRPSENPSPEDEDMKRKAKEHAVIERDAKAGTLPEPYEFEAYASWSMGVIQGTIGQLFYTHCIHRAPDRTGCAQGMCDTLDRLEHRLWKVEG